MHWFLVYVLASGFMIMGIIAGLEEEEDDC